MSENCPRGCRRNGFRHFYWSFRIEIISCFCYWLALFACSRLIVACRRRIAGVVMSTFCYLQVSVDVCNCPVHSLGEI
jgi:hypothetical protein